MDNRAIGVFDSGLGGLTAVKELQALLPNQDIVYFGDTGRVPYGSRSNETVIQYTKQDIRFLETFDPKLILMACGTASSVALTAIEEQVETPLIGVVQPASLTASETTKNGKVAIIGTQSTIASKSYEKAIAAFDAKIKTTAVACPLFVPIVENWRIEKEDPVVQTLVSDYLQSIKEFGADVLILGCTHYPLLSNAINDFFGGKVTLINPGAEAASYVQYLLQTSNKEAPRTVKGDLRCYVSDKTQSFEHLASLFLEQELTGKVEKIDIESY